MDAVKYLEEALRMCNSMKSCSDCLLHELNAPCYPCRSYGDSAETMYPEKCVEIIEKWSDEHQNKTRQGIFLKIFPDAPIVNGHIDICPKYTDDKIPGYDYCYKLCEDCKKEYWLAEVE